VSVVERTADIDPDAIEARGHTAGGNGDDSARDRLCHTAHAARALRHYTELCGTSNEHPEWGVLDLLIGLVHLCGELGLADFELLAAQARGFAGQA
jgi:hypothetical protein